MGNQDGFLNLPFYFTFFRRFFSLIRFFFHFHRIRPFFFQRLELLFTVYDLPI